MMEQYRISPEARPPLMPTLLKCTPILHVDAIEPCLPFWTERLGFQVTVQIAAGEALGFAILAKDGVEVMYQTRAAAARELGDPGRVPETRGTMLFIEVDDISAVEQALTGIHQHVPRRLTFYGAEELFVYEPGGNLVGFAQMRGV